MMTLAELGAFESPVAWGTCLGAVRACPARQAGAGPVRWVAGRMVVVTLALHTAFAIATRRAGRSCHSQTHRYHHSCRYRCYCSWLPKSPPGKAGGSVCPSNQPDIGTVHEQGHSHQSGHSHRHWHSLHQTVPSGREAGSEHHATQGCKYRLQFGGCRLRRGHTGNWHCN